MKLIVLHLWKIVRFGSLHGDVSSLVSFFKLMFIENLPYPNHGTKCFTCIIFFNLWDYHFIAKKWDRKKLSDLQVFTHCKSSHNHMSELACESRQSNFRFQFPNCYTSVISHLQKFVWWSAQTASFFTPQSSALYSTVSERRDDCRLLLKLRKLAQGPGIPSCLPEQAFSQERLPHHIRFSEARSQVPNALWWTRCDEKPSAKLCNRTPEANLSWLPLGVNFTTRPFFQLPVSIQSSWPHIVLRPLWALSRSQQK